MAGIRASDDGRRSERGAPEADDAQLLSSTSMTGIRPPSDDGCRRERGAPEADDSQLLTSKQVRALLGNCSEMHIWRLLNVERYQSLNFPRRITINRRNYFRRRDILQWIEQQILSSAKQIAAAVIILFLISAAMALPDGTANALQGAAVATLVSANDNAGRVVGRPASDRVAARRVDRCAAQSFDARRVGRTLRSGRVRARPRRRRNARRGMTAPPFRRDFRRCRAIGERGLIEARDAAFAAKPTA
jgi:predicted DNA-binding transcriptional regulator AlpA